MTTAVRPLGADIGRIDGPRKVSGTATYAYEHPLTGPAYVVALLSSVARGRVTAIDSSQAEALPGVLAVLAHESAPRLADTEDRELAILQTPEIHFRGQVVGAVVADSLEIATHAAGLVRVQEQASEHDVVLTADHPQLFKPQDESTDTSRGDAEAGLRAAATTVDATYTTPHQHQGATVVCGSSGLLCWLGVRYVASIAVAAERSAVSTSPSELPEPSGA